MIYITNNAVCAILLSLPIGTIYAVGHKNVPNSSDHSARTKTR